MTRFGVALIIALAVFTATAEGQSASTNGARWEVLPTWGQLPAGLQWEAASQISTTPDGQIVVLRRANPFFVVLTPDGTVVRTWGENLFRLAHGLRIDRSGSLWVTDNTDNVVQKFAPDGTLLMTLGTRGVAGGNDAHGAFDGPADVFITSSGDILVADGYRNSRVARFSSDGTFRSIIGGTKGSAPGEFNLPHAVVIDSKGRVIVADAENSRIQVFDQNGKFIEQWTDFASKPRGAMYITPDDTLYVSHVDSESITIMKNGKVLDRITGVGGRPHGLTIDARGNIYVANPASRSVKKIVRK
jgi:DNA-binding beta-propeller fold protein YncE